MARRKLGEMLIAAGVLDDNSLRIALADQRRWGRPLGRTLVELRLIAEEELVHVLAQQLGLEAVDLDQIEVPQAVIDLVPPDLARQHNLVPFGQPMKFLDVAMIDPTNLGVIDELRIRTQLNIRSFLAGPRQIERAIARYYGHGIGMRPDVDIAFDGPDTIGSAGPRYAPVREQRPTRPQPLGTEGLRPYPRTMPPSIAMPEPVASSARDAEIDALQERLQRLEALVARDEEVLRKLLALLIDKGVATRDEILERLG